ncbi:hypothetical protein [Thermaerobacillus caldiproteolyticus]|uniref:Uncharacterized protein n=1 Tax=Thermaerobacillus caldiproteolyticus TaxID=247480 RepID=A0A7V9ZA89_9BACL|nr:hypothetical protein [Anoxybacillus caldiproteolyticus]MBA2876919.1 hypothetical protein [Anoxybacillus caldiproteolyticus]
MNNEIVNYVEIINSIREWLLNQGSFGEVLLDQIDREIEEQLINDNNENSFIKGQLSFDNFFLLDEENLQLDILDLHIKVIKEFLVILPSCWDEINNTLKTIDESISIHFIFSESISQNSEFENKNYKYKLITATKQDVFPVNIDEIKENIIKVERIIKELKQVSK